MRDSNMDERSLILKAISKKQEPQEEIDFDNITEPDAIDKWVKAKKRKEKHKYKTVDEWSTVDMVNYLDSMLKQVGIYRVRTNVRAESNIINTLHDRFVQKLPEETNVTNQTIKDYLEWWCSLWASRFTGGNFRLSHLVQDWLIQRFCSRYEQKTVEHEVLAPQPESSINDDQIYDLGGLELVIMKRGLVIGVNDLKKRQVADPAHEVRKVLEDFNKDTLVDVINVTIHNSPYPQSHRVNFISLAEPFLRSHGLSEFLSLSHEKFFHKEKTD